MPTADLSTVLDLFERGETAEAVPLLEHLARLLPTNVTTYVLLARALEAERSWSEALAAWQWAAFLMPNSPIVERGRRRAIRALAAEPQAPRTAPLRAAATEPDAAEPDETLVEAAAEASAAASEAEPAGEYPAASGADDVPEDEPADPLDLTEPAPRRARPTPRFPGTPPLSVSGPSTPAGRSDLESYDDLDRLIEELEAARIVPQPDLDTVPAPELDDDIEDMVSETLARIYAAQGQHDEAARVYELLAAQQPERAGEFRAKADAARSRAAS